MIGDSLLKLGAWTAIGAGILLAVADLQHLNPEFNRADAKFSEVVQQPVWAIHGALHVAANTLFLIALPAIFLAQAHRMGRPGLAAYAGLFVAYVSYTGVSFVMAFATPDMDPAVIDAPPAGVMAVLFLAYPLSAIALAAFGVLTVRARVFPRWTGVALAAGAIGALVLEMFHAPVTGALLVGAGLAGLGIHLHKLALAAPSGLAKVAGPGPLETN